MSDPRFTYRDKKLPPMRQDGFVSGDYKDPDAETKRRLKELLEAVEPAKKTPVGPGQSGTGLSPVNPAPPVDRWHKFGLFYVTVSPINLPGQDPGGIQQNSWVPTITEGIAKAVELYNSMALLYVAPRVIVEVHGGEYKEDVTVPDHIDIIGIGQPTIIGLFTIDPLCRQTLIRSFHFQNPSLSMLSLPITALDTALTYEPPIVFQDCYFEGNSDIGDTYRRAKFIRCIFTTNHVNAPIRVNFHGSVMRKTIFENCSLYSKLSVTLYPNDVCIKITTVTNGGLTFFDNLLTAESGVEFRDCQIFGTVFNQGWQVLVQGGKMYGGLIVPPLGPTPFNVLVQCGSITADNPTNVDSYTTIDNVVCVGSIVALYTDLFATNTGAANHVRFRSSSHLISNNDLPTIAAFKQAPLPNVGAGDVSIINCFTSATLGWNDPGIAVSFIDAQSALSFNIPTVDLVDIFLP